MRYLLDTCIIAALLNREQGHERLEERIAGAPRGSLQISAITAVEVWIGLARPRTPRGKSRLFEALLRQMRVLAFDEAAARQAFVVRRYLETDRPRDWADGSAHRCAGHHSGCRLRDGQPAPLPAHPGPHHRKLAADSLRTCEG